MGEQGRIVGRVEARRGCLGGCVTSSCLCLQAKGRKLMGEQGGCVGRVGSVGVFGVCLGGCVTPCVCVCRRRGES